MRRHRQPHLVRERASAYYRRLRYWLEMEIDDKGHRLNPAKLPEADRPYAMTIGLIESGAEVEVVGWSTGLEPEHARYRLQADVRARRSP